MQKEDEKRKQREIFEKSVRNEKIRIFGEDYADAHVGRIRGQPEDIEKISKFRTEKKDMLVYLGNCGIGKTFVCAALWEWAKYIFSSVRYWKESDIQSRLRRSITEFKSGDYHDVLEGLIDDEFLLIDEIAKDSITDFRKEALSALLDYRSRRRLPTVLVSNFTANEFRLYYHERIYDRLMYNRNFIIERFDGASFRTDIKKE